MTASPPSLPGQRALPWWTAVALVELYLAVAIDSVSHRDLFLVAPVRLPLLGLPVPLTMFAIAVPIGLLALLAVTLLQGRRGLLAVAPALILLQAQLVFLPLHSPAVTWTHRLCLLVGLVLVWFGWRGLGAGRRLGWIVLSVLVAAFSGLVAAFPGEWVYERTGGWLSGILPDSLDLQGQSFVSPAFGDPDAAGPVLRGRRLEKASFFLADVRRVDFSGAALDGANFVQADVRGTKFVGAAMRGTSFGNGAMEGADFSDARLEGADFNSQLSGVIFRRAHMRGAWFGFGVPTHLEGADLAGAELEGAVFESVFLQGADLRGAKLAGVTFGSNPYGGSSLDGAALDGAELQGAELGEMSLAGASLRQARVWRTTSVPALALADTTGIDRETRPTLDVDAIRRFSAGNPFKDEQSPRLAMLDPAKPEPAKATPAATWAIAAPATRALAEFLRDLACTTRPDDPSAREQPYIARGILANGRLAATGRDIVLVADRMKAAKDDPAACPAARGFGDNEWKLLDELLAKAR